MVIPHAYSKIKFKDIGWKARAINGAGSWISFSLLWTCVGINTSTPMHTQEEIPECPQWPQGERSGPQRCHGFSSCLLAPSPFPFSPVRLYLCAHPLHVFLSLWWGLNSDLFCLWDTALTVWNLLTQTGFSSCLSHGEAGIMDLMATPVVLALFPKITRTISS